MNQIIISGNVGKDAEKGQYDIRFTVATNKSTKTATENRRKRPQARG